MKEQELKNLFINYMYLQISYNKIISEKSSQFLCLIDMSQISIELGCFLFFCILDFNYVVW